MARPSAADVGRDSDHAAAAPTTARASHSRQRAIAYFMENAAKTELDVTNETDRYIGWPGQALAYKIGELKIEELRARAQQRLGSRFDLRAFNDVVLQTGAVPLEVLEHQVDAWIDLRK